MLADQPFLRRLEQLRKLARRVGRQGRGEHQSRQRGPGLELADHRPYAAGDDPRRLDWNAFARLERPLLRLHHADQNLPIYLLLDRSGSMAVGAPPKLDQAVRVAAALAYLGVCALDPVLVLPFAGRAGPALDVSAGKRQLPSLFAQLEALSGEGLTDLEAAVSSFLSRQRPRGVVVLLSDFLGGGAPGDVQRPLLRLRHARHLTTVIQITASEDRHAPEPVGGQALEEVLAVDVETGTARVVPLSPEIRAGYEREVRGRLEALGRFCRGRGINYLAASAEQPFDTVVMRLLRTGGLGA